MLRRLGRWAATDDREPGHDAATALALWERLRADGDRVVVTATPTQLNGVQLDPRHHPVVECAA